MVKITTCNKCGEMFDLAPERFHTIEEDGLSVEYFDCPFCLARYHVFTADDEMKVLVQKRKDLTQKIRLSKVAHAREKTLVGLFRELEKVKQAQKVLVDKLAIRGEAVMNRGKE